MADEGYSITITFQSGFIAELYGVNWDGIARNAIETTHATSAGGWRTFQPSDLLDPGGLNVAIAFDPDDDPPIDQAAETITVNYPIPSGGSTAATWACSGFMTEYDNEAPFDDKMTASVVLKFSGQPTFTPGT